MAKVTKKITSQQAYELALESLQIAKLKVTKPRMAILNVLIRHGRPFTTDEIYQEVRKQGADRVTVYRGIEAFQENGIVRRCDFGEGPVRFEYQGPGSEHHHHIICRRCKKVEDLKHCLVAGLENILKKSGYAHITHSLEFFGVCAKCLKS